MKTKCIECGVDIEYEPIKNALNADLCYLRLSLCSNDCEYSHREKAQAEVSKNVFYRVLNVLPDAYKGVKMSDFEKADISQGGKPYNYKELVQSYCNSKYWNISLFSTQYGNGKTRMGLYILACLALKGVYKTREIHNIQDAGYYSAIDIVKILRTETFDSKQYHLKRFYSSRALMIDDLGQEPKQFSTEIAGILKVREETYKKTIITSNCDKNELIERYTGRIYSRIAKGAFNISGSDYRMGVHSE